MPQPAAQSPRLNLRQRAARRRRWWPLHRRTKAASGLGCFGTIFRALRLVAAVAAGVAGGVYVDENFLKPDTQRGPAALGDREHGKQQEETTTGDKPRA